MIRLCHVVLVLALAVPGKALSQTGNASHPDDAHRLAVLARDVWAPVELASLGFQARDPNATVSAERLRRACLLNEAAGRRDPLCQSAARDLCLLHTSAAIDDPGRAAESIARYSSLQPQDAYPVEIWLRFRLDHLGNRKAKEEFLRQTLPALRDYPLIRSQAMTELGNLALEKGLIDDMPATTEQAAQRGARSWFTQAFYESSLYNLNAMERLLALPEPDLSPSLAGADEEQLQQQQQAVRDERTLYTALRWRLTLRNDPFNPAAADQLVRTLESLGKFQLAQQYYPHLIHLLEQETLSAQARRDVRLRQLRGAYLAGLHRQAVDLARQMLNDEPDDVLAGAVLALALRRLDMPEEADAALQRVTSVNLEQMQQAQTPPPSQLLEMAWLFCFVDPDPEQALRLAQQACPENTDTPVSARCAAIRAYAHLLNQ